MEKQKEKKQFVCLSGLPRTGSTLLSAILGQNPKIHAEGNSAVCQLMWDMYCSCTQNAKEQLLANNRSHTMMNLIKSIPQVYYKDILETAKHRLNSYVAPSTLRRILPGIMDYIQVGLNGNKSSLDDLSILKIDLLNNISLMR
jgi:hypothetical protein